MTPYFGGKRAVASLVWRRLGSVANYVEPVCGSAAVLLARPHPPRVETVNDPTLLFSNFERATHPERGDPEAVAAEVLNDADPYLANVWRSIQRAPEDTAAWADAPVDESYLHATHRWLVLGDGAEGFRERMRTDPAFYDPRRAGLWLFGICAWIGGGWCAHNNGPGRRPVLSNPGSDSGGGVHGKSKLRIDGDNPGSVGKGVHAGGGLSQQLPDLSGEAAASGRGIHAIAGPPRNRPRCDSEHGSSGQGGSMPGVHGSLKEGRPQLADQFDIGRGVHSNGELGTCAQRREWLVAWFSRLRDRLRNVRVCCGDWSRVCSSESVTTRLGLTGVFLDPPYSKQAGRNMKLYAKESGAVAHDVRAWCLGRGGERAMRIALCGYEGEGHEELEAHGWRVEAWRAHGGYGNRTERGQANAGRERIWFSPHCVFERSLFEGGREE